MKRPNVLQDWLDENRAVLVTQAESDDGYILSVWAFPHGRIGCYVITREMTDGDLRYLGWDIYIPAHEGNDVQSTLDAASAYVAEGRSDG